MKIKYGIAALMLAVICHCIYLLAVWNAEVTLKMYQINCECRSDKFKPNLYNSHDK